MKTSKILQLFFSLGLICCSLIACDKDDETLASIKEITFEGEASTQEINMTRSNWSISSVTDPYGGFIYDINNRPIFLEDLGTIHFGWGSIVRDKKNALTVTLNDNFEKEERVFIINLRMKEGFYAEAITVRQKQCTSFYQIQSIAYTLEEGDGIREAASRLWGITYIDKRGEEGVPVTTKMSFNLLYMEDINYSFSSPDFNEEQLSPESGKRLVDMPEGIENGKLFFEKNQYNYTETGMYRNQQMGESYEVDLVSWKRNLYSARIYYQRLQATYTLTLLRPGSESLKIVKGKFTKEFPYSHSPIKHEVTELAEGD